MQTQNFLFDELETAKEIQSDNDMQTRIVEYWYRGSLEIDTTQGNGKLAELAQ